MSLVNCNLCNAEPAERIYKNVQLGVQYMVGCLYCSSDAQPPVTANTPEKAEQLWNQQNEE